MAHPPNPQFIQQFLSTVLSQRGPSALPYAEELKWHIRNHLVALTSEFPSLNPKTATYTHNDGRTVNLLQADGTVPMLFQGVTYNIPVVIWLMESYPTQPPLVYVNPTRDMIIKRPHPFVNPSGSVSIPYLHDWIFPTSNLVILARELSNYFARDPPLYSQRRPPPPQTPSPSPSPSPSSCPNPNFSISAGMARPAIPPRSYPPSPYGSSSNSSFGRIPYRPPPETEDPSEVFKRNAINKIVENVHTDIGAMRKAREAEMEAMFSAQAVLREREEQLARGLQEMQGEKEGLEHRLQMVLMNSDLLEGWLRENEVKIAKMRSVDVDDAFEPMDGLSKQMIECTASDLAIEDVVYSLDKAVQEGAVPFDQYLRNVRMLSREQFFHRAMTSKVRAAQMQAQIGSMAARVPPLAT